MCVLDMSMIITDGARLLRLVSASFGFAFSWRRTFSL